jgi:hypothetical protein
MFMREARLIGKALRESIVSPASKNVFIFIIAAATVGGELQLS